MAVSKPAAASFAMAMQLHTNTVANLLLSGSCPSMDAFNLHGAAPTRIKKKPLVVFVMGATGTGKSKLAIDLAARYPAEVVNSDKIQIHRGLDVVTNKVTDEERAGVPHHLLGYDCCFLCVGVALAAANEATWEKLLVTALEEIKANTRELARRQREKIRRLQQSAGWVLHQLNATEAFLRRGPEADEAWKRLVEEPAVGIVRSFLCRSEVIDEGNKAEVGCRADVDGRCGGGVAATEVGCNWGSACSCNCAANDKLVTAAATTISANVPATIC